MGAGKEGIQTKTAANNGGSTSTRGHPKEDAIKEGQQPKWQVEILYKTAQN